MPPAIDIDWNEPRAQRFKEAMDDDFNTPEAVAVLFEIANELNRSRSPEDAALLKALGGVLGLLQQDPVLFLQGSKRGDSYSHETGSRCSSTGVTRHARQGDSTDAAIDDAHRCPRRRAKAKNYAEADRIRKELLDAGIVLEDKPGGVTEWRRA